MDYSEQLSDLNPANLLARAPRSVAISKEPRRDGAISHGSQSTGISAVGPVLVIEDHVDTRLMLELFLDLNGIAAVSAENGLTGLAALRQHRPSVILLDLSMPVMDGWTFRAEQQKLSDPELAGVPVVVLSALTYCERHGEQLQAAAVIPKPVDFDRLLQVIGPIACASLMQRTLRKPGA